MRLFVRVDAACQAVVRVVVQEALTGGVVRGGGLGRGRDRLGVRGGGLESGGSGMSGG
jgi:uncharacterized membrane protein YgcG